ncbi:hypothetical protein MBLNU457_4123t1 [Dothideomycetes sp. NU457]
MEETTMIDISDSQAYTNLRQGMTDAMRNLLTRMNHIASIELKIMSPVTDGNILDDLLKAKDEAQEELDKAYAELGKAISLLPTLPQELWAHAADHWLPLQLSGFQWRVNELEKIKQGFESRAQQLDQEITTALAENRAETDKHMTAAGRCFTNSLRREEQLRRQQVELDVDNGASD